MTTPEKRLTGKIALVTGASRGLGRAVSLALAREGAHVIISGRTTGALEELDDEIAKIGGTATILALDLTKGDKLDQLGPSLYQRWQHLDIFVANAAVLGPLSPLSHVTADAWSSVIDTNLTANWRLIRT
ncbi:MAG: SDR family NAD(P)-dependent oxidoreductase, partial [Hyphomicrobium sp.]